MKISEAKGKLKVGMRVKLSCLDSNDIYFGIILNANAEYFTADDTVNSRRIGTFYFNGSNDADWSITILSKNISKNTMVDISKVKFGVSYMRDEDPVEFFGNRKDAEKRIDELRQDSEVSDIYLFEVGGVYRVETPVSYKLVKVK